MTEKERASLRAMPSIGEQRRSFNTNIRDAVHDPGRVGRTGSPAEMLRNVSVVVLDAHGLGGDGRCTSCVSVHGSLAEPVEWPCDEVVRLGRIYGIWWVRL